MGSKSVMPGVLTVDDVIDCSQDFLNVLPMASTEIVQKKVRDFIDANIESEDVKNKTAAEKLYVAYEHTFRQSDYMKGSTARDMANVLAKISLDDVKAQANIVDLQKKRSTILDLLSEDQDFINSYKNVIEESETKGLKMAYTPKMDKENFESFIRMLYTVPWTSADTLHIRDAIIGKIQAFKQLFINPKSEDNKRTQLSRSFERRDALIEVLRGLDYVIPRLQNGVEPMTWRRC